MYATVGQGTHRCSDCAINCTVHSQGPSNLDLSTPGQGAAKWPFVSNQARFQFYSWKFEGYGGKCLTPIILLQVKKSNATYYCPIIC